MRIRSVTFSHGVLPPHHASLRTSSMRSPFVNFASLYGPVPIAALPELKSSVDAFANCLLMIAICVMSDGISGYGCAVLKRIVYGSTTSIFWICFV